MIATDQSARPAPWLFTRRIDLTVFLGSGLLALGALALGGPLGLLEGDRTDSPEWAWITAILLIDVAHVWATGFQVYFRPSELTRRPQLYAFVPIAALAVGVALYSEGERLFWRVLAYLAVFHFVRQQYGWVALYRARAGESSTGGKIIDGCAIYLSMLYPLVWWHANLPRNFSWFLPGDFVRLSSDLAAVLQPLFWTSLTLYAVRAGWVWLLMGRPNFGKDIVVATTALCWYLGIVVYDSDYAFTVTNVIIHGVPYIALVWWVRVRSEPTPAARPFNRLVVILGVIWALAFVEELLWDRGVWRERGWLFGSGWNTSELRMFLVPLLAVPQLTHYILDGFIWRRRDNPDVATALSGRRE